MSVQFGVSPMDTTRGVTTAAQAEPLDRRSPVPLWSQLSHDLRRRVEEGAFVEAFPSELALVAEYGVSRNTVRDALRSLRADGLVVAGRGRRPRLGTQVEIEQPLGALYSLYSSVESAGHVPRSAVRVLDRRCDRAVSKLLALPPDAPLVYLERLRLADGEPLAIVRVWFPHAIAAPLLEVDFREVGFYDELATRAGVRLTGGRERIRSVVPSRAEQALLLLPKGAAAFEIDRLGFVEHEPVEWRTTIVRGDRFSVVAEFSAATGYRLELKAQGPTPTG